MLVVVAAILFQGAPGHVPADPLDASSPCSGYSENLFQWLPKHRVYGQNCRCLVSIDTVDGRTPALLGIYQIL